MELTTTKRTITGKKVRQLRSQGIIPAVVYGQEIGSIPLTVTEADFRELYHQVSEGGLLTIKVDDQRYSVLLRDLQIDPVSRQLLHIDFFQASLTEEVEVEVPIVIEGVSLAVKELGGTLVKNLPEITVKALAHNLPHEIKVLINNLNTFEDHILVKDLLLPANVRALAKPDEIVVSVAPPADVEADLAKEIEEKVEDVEKVEKEKKEEEVVEEEPAEKPQPEKK